MGFEFRTGMAPAIALGTALAIGGSAGLLCVQALAPSEAVVIPTAQAKSSVKQYTTWTCKSKAQYESRDKSALPIASYGKLQRSRLTLTGSMYLSTGSQDFRKLKAKRRSFKVSPKVKCWNSTDHKYVSFGKAQRYVKSGCKLSFKVTGGKVTYIYTL